MRPFRSPVLMLVAALSVAAPFAAPVAAQAADEPHTVEYYYKIRWGAQDEWMQLYKKNHYPVLLKMQELGRIVSMSAATPANHAGEANRWDFRFTITWKNANVAYEDFDSSAILEALYPDQELFRREEQRRFELLVEHLDVPVFVDDLRTWPKR